MQHISTEISSERSRVQNQNMGTNLSRSATLQPINFVTLTRVTNNASCNWVNLVQVSSTAVNSPIAKHVLRTPVGELQFSSVHFVCCEHGFIGQRARRRQQ